MSQRLLISIAEELDLAQFSACLDDEIDGDIIDANFEDGRARRAIGTPTFIINDRFLIGARPLET